MATMTRSSESPSRSFLATSPRGGEMQVREPLLSDDLSRMETKHFVQRG